MYMTKLQLKYNMTEHDIIAAIESFKKCCELTNRDWDCIDIYYISGLDNYSDKEGVSIGYRYYGKDLPYSKDYTYDFHYYKQKEN